MKDEDYEILNEKQTHFYLVVGVVDNLLNSIHFMRMMEFLCNISYLDALTEDIEVRGSTEKMTGFFIKTTEDGLLSLDEQKDLYYILRELEAHNPSSSYWIKFYTLTGQGW